MKNKQKKYIRKTKSGRPKINLGLVFSNIKYLTLICLTKNLNKDNKFPTFTDYQYALVQHPNSKYLYSEEPKIPMKQFYKEKILKETLHDVQNIMEFYYNDRFNNNLIGFDDLIDNLANLGTLNMFGDLIETHNQNVEKKCFPKWGDLEKYLNNLIKLGVITKKEDKKRNARYRVTQKAKEKLNELNIDYLRSALIFKIRHAPYGLIKRYKKDFKKFYEWLNDVY